jgi:hypothetical protein
MQGHPLRVGNVLLPQYPAPYLLHQSHFWVTCNSGDTTASSSARLLTRSRLQPLYHCIQLPLYLGQRILLMLQRTVRIL